MEFTSEEIAARLKAHQKKYPLKLGGVPMREWLAQKAQEEDGKNAQPKAA